MRLNFFWRLKGLVACQALLPCCLKSAKLEAGETEQLLLERQPALACAGSPSRLTQSRLISLCDFKVTLPGRLYSRTWAPATPSIQRRCDRMDACVLLQVPELLDVVKPQYLVPPAELERMMAERKPEWVPIRRPPVGYESNPLPPPCPDTGIEQPCIPWSGEVFKLCSRHRVP